MDILNTPAPPPRKRVKRLTDEIKNLKPGQSFITDYDTARCAVAHFRYKGYKPVQQEQPDGRIQVWVNVE